MKHEMVAVMMWRFMGLQAINNPSDNQATSSDIIPYSVMIFTIVSDSYLIYCASAR